MTEMKSTVYVIDDDPSIRTSLHRLFKSVGLSVETFSSAPEFLTSPPIDGPACLVLDVRMPELSGLDLQEELARAGIAVPIIFITGHGSVPMSVRAMTAGAVDFLEKPVDDQDLLDCVHRTLEQDRLKKQERNETDEIKSRFESLTAREREVMTYVVTGRLNKQIASELDISEKTVKVHRARVMKKMKVTSLAELVRFADRLKISLPDVR
jgi:FixJ family two-component response regulator